MFGFVREGFVLVVKICLNVSVPYIFIYKDMNIFIIALSGRSVNSIGNVIVFFLHCIRIYGWMVFSFFTAWFLNQYHSSVSFNHNYSGTWLSFQINIACFYHLRGILPWQSKSRNISFSVSHIKMTRWFWLFCCISFIVYRLRIRIWIWLLSEMPFVYFHFVNANSSQVYRPQGSSLQMSCNYMRCMVNAYWQLKISNTLLILDMFMFWLPMHSHEGWPWRKIYVCLNLKLTCELGIVKSCWVEHSSHWKKKTSWAH